MQLITSENMQLEFAMLIQTMSIVFMSCINSDDDNCLYVTEFMDFFQNYVSMKEEVSVNWQAYIKITPWVSFLLIL